ncbi:MAG: iron-containing alcohol dehydrogenase [Proteobacteria bacterium]|nr:iron-containing alcohol dehydrogenase [Cystobacterineae bacterium]MCL2258485.1 iron-containing alcohol dehydrogenase [Cystobacterineae bacterium]MCL2315175.1 iron-containing alcohol dehydrogenase [Pseudomonadota bacterium]
MHPFRWYMPTRLHFGTGSLELLSKLPLPGHKALLVVGQGGSARRLGYLDEVLSLLQRRGCEAVVFDKIQPNPTSEQVDEGAVLARGEGCHFVVGLGGGSSLDAAKSIALMMGNEGAYWDYMGGTTGKKKTPKFPAKPVVAIPTTSGTGSETDPWTVITRLDSREKLGWGCDSTYPQLALIEPRLMLSLPPAQTAMTGMDAFFHAIEAYLATCHQPGSDVLALDIAARINRWLPRAVQHPEDLEARIEMAWAATGAGICESLSSCISHHSLEHALSAFHPKLPHGAGLCMLALPYFSSLAPFVPERMADLAKAMGQPAKADAFLVGLEKLIAEVGLNALKLSDYGIVPEEFPALAKNALDVMGGLFSLTPMEQDENALVHILRQAWRP